MHSADSDHCSDSGGTTPEDVEMSELGGRIDDGEAVEDADLF